jgi:hypothetical protein
MQMRRVLGFLATGSVVLASLAIGSLAVADDGGPHPRDFDGVWWTPGYDRKFRTIEGEMPPFTERGRREWEHNVAMDKAGTPVADAPTGCLPHGIPRLLASPYPIQIVTTPGQMTWVHEVNRNQRWIYMDEKHPPNLPKTYLGHSVGHWEGDMLVIDTVALNDKTRIDEEGITHSDQLHVVERIRKIDGGALLRRLMKERGLTVPDEGRTRLDLHRGALQVGTRGGCVWRLRAAAVSGAVPNRPAPMAPMAKHRCHLLAIARLTIAEGLPQPSAIVANLDIAPACHGC